MNHVLHPGEISVSCRWQSKLPAWVFLQFVSSPITEIEWRVRHDEVSLQRGMLVVEERVGIRLSEVGFQSTDGHVHVRHLPCAGVCFLAIYADTRKLLLVVLDELGTLHKHATRAAAGVIDTALEGLQYLHDGADDATWRVELAGILAFHRSEFL